MNRCEHRLEWIDEGAYECDECGVEKVRYADGGPLYTIDEDGRLTDWTGQPQQGGEQ